MKKFAKYFCIVCFMLCLVCFSGCDVSFLQGKSAYEIAVDNGFVGSETEWLESLKGSDGQNGLNGAVGESGKDGDDITAQSLFELAVSYGLYENNAEGYSKFLSDYLSDNVQTNTVEEVTSKCLNQVVSIYCENSQGEMQAGAGVFYKIDKEQNYAYIITNYHVVCCEEEVGYAEASNIVVYLYGQETLIKEGNIIDYGTNAIEAKYIGGSANYDLAILKVSGVDFEKIENSDASAVSIADTDIIQPGSTAIAIGNPMGSGTSVTSGVVSVDSEYIIVNIGGGARQLRCLRIDTSVNGGNSGGGLFDINGNLVGIVNAKKTNYIEDDNSLTVYENVAYAICGSNVKSVASNIIDFYNKKIAEAEQNGEETEGINVGVHKFLIGVTVTSKNPKNVYNSSNNTNVLKEDVVVTEVSSGGIAESIGFQAGDIIRKVIVSRDENQTVYDITRRFELLDDMLNLRVGDDVVYNVERLNSKTGLYEAVSLEAFNVTYEGYTEYKGVSI